jgi:hypothetical protein
VYLIRGELRLEDIQKAYEYASFPGTWFLWAIFSSIAGLNLEVAALILHAVTFMAYMLFLKKIASLVFDEYTSQLACAFFSLFSILVLLHFSPQLYGIMLFMASFYVIFKASANRNSWRYLLLLVLSIFAITISHPLTSIIFTVTASVLALHRASKSFMRSNTIVSKNHHILRMLLPLALLSITTSFCWWIFAVPYQWKEHALLGYLSHAIQSREIVYLGTRESTTFFAQTMRAYQYSLLFWIYGSALATSVKFRSSKNVKEIILLLLSMAFGGMAMRLISPDFVPRIYWYIHGFIVALSAYGLGSIRIKRLSMILPILIVILIIPSFLAQRSYEQVTVYDSFKHPWELQAMEFLSKYLHSDRPITLSTDIITYQIYQYYSLDALTGKSRLAEFFGESPPLHSDVVIRTERQSIWLVDPAMGLVFPPKDYWRAFDGTLTNIYNSVYDSGTTKIYKGTYK